MGSGSRESEADAVVDAWRDQLDLVYDTCFGRMHVAY